MDKQKKRNLRSMLISVGVIIVALLVVYFGAQIIINQLEHTGMVTERDVQSTITLTSKYFIPLAVILGLIVLALIVFWNKSRKFNFWLKWESFVVFLVALVVTLNVVVFEPMQALMNVNFANVKQVSASAVNEGKQVTNQIANEGTILLKNEKNYLPIKAQNINVFGWASSNPLYGGTGSGAGNTTNATDIYQSLNDAGFKTNDQLLNFYKKYRKDRPTVSMWTQDWTLPEPKVSQYSTSMMNHAKKFSDTAMVVIGRSGGEGADLPTDMSKLPAKLKNTSTGNLDGGSNGVYAGNKGDFKKGQSYLELSQTEKNMLQMVNKNFKNVIVLINSSNPMELGFLNQYSHIKSALLMSGPGMTGFSALGKVLNGEVNPSGRTPDTYVYDLKKNPSYNNFGDFRYRNVKDATFVNYVEGIYVGYKYYETRYLNNESGYKKAVLYPFGYGLSYTKFSQRMSNLKRNFKSGKFSFDVTVRNTGKRAGKDVVQAYFTAPYKNGGIEKSATNLLDFAKTKNLKPGESQTIHFSFNQEDLASWDSSNGGRYVLDSGRYQVQIKNNSHDVIASRSFNLNNKVVYDSSNKRPSDKVVAKNQFQYAKGDNVTYLSRKDNFANFDKATKAPAAATLSKHYLETATIVSNKNYGKAPEASGKMPSQKQASNITLSDLRGKDYNDQTWNKLINKMSINDMSKVIQYGGYQTFRNARIGKVETYDFDGPSGLSSTFVKMNTTMFPAAEMIASTWNKKLAYDRGKSVGKQGKESGVFGWYGPAMNIHRSAFGGRDFEYYSEDPILSGNMGSNEVAGAKSQGVYSYIKHFAMNNQETNRMAGLMTWSNEQAIRETYLKAFEMSVKRGGATAAMDAFNFIGNRWCGANKQLLQNVLRNEWGFRRFVETDYFVGKGVMNVDAAIANGGDLALSTTGVGAKVQYTDNPTQVRYMRKAVHNILYTIVNSGAYDSANYKKGESTLLPYQKSFITYFVVAYVVIALIQVLVIFLYRRKYVKPTSQK
ncbi:beta-glucosidase [Lactobacillus colini]|uniref:Beta-glucosidase n=1 Tax=Lactobacillus colini TaxID=1819254 RepID=A0ABS4MC24_9LACO|nr:glycoside hydrolase family 3 C-terminal domain-containing protein [Lactobacillus colini]MBP2056942.1 beta-glucosidase [Lactobacillus colini]